MIKRMSWREKWEMREVILIQPGQKNPSLSVLERPLEINKSRSGKGVSSHELMLNDE